MGLVRTLISDVFVSFNSLFEEGVKQLWHAQTRSRNRK